jgi:hypothetical protein
VPTRFWYSAYPGVTTTAIRRNADIRRELSGAMTEDEAIRWLALFGSAFRPQAKLVNPDIQSLILGGLSFLPFGTCLLFDLPQDVEKSRRWLAGIFRHIAFNDGRRLRDDAIVTIALGPGGFEPTWAAQARARNIPFASSSMATEDRARMLGDIRQERSVELAMGHVHTRRRPVGLRENGCGREAAGGLVAIAGRRRLGCSDHDSTQESFKIEPFGFADGIYSPSSWGPRLCAAPTRFTSSKRENSYWVIRTTDKICRRVRRCRQPPIQTTICHS